MYDYGLQRVTLYLVILITTEFFFGGRHNIHYDSNLEGTLGGKKNHISKKKILGKGGA